MTIQQGKKNDLVCYLLLALFLVIAYLPVSSFLFALKNDALTDNFPNKYFFSAALQSGCSPVWNPYMNFGLPLYADPGFAFWQPITWLFGFVGYNIYVLSIEVLVYIWLGGVFMYELGKYFGHSVLLRYLMAVMYMCCGFFIGNLQDINFITCAAFLPIVVKTFLQLQDKFSYRRILYCVLSLYMLSTGGHPAIPFATIYFLAAIFLGLLFFRNNDINRKTFYLQLLKSNLLLIIFFSAFAFPLLYSYAEILPNISRSTPVNHLNNGYDGYSIPSYMSFLFPFATSAKNISFNNGSLMRNGYFSFVGFAFFIAALFSKRNKYQIVFLAAGLLMLLLSLGGTVKAFLYPYLPFLDYIRINGEYRVFSIFSFIIVASFPLGKSIANNDARVVERILWVFGGITGALILWSVIHHSQMHLFLNQLHKYDNPESKSNLKGWLDNLGIYDRLFLGGIVLLFFLVAYFVSRRKLPLRILLPIIMLADLITFSWMLLPVTGVQKRSVSSIQNYFFSEVKRGIPVPSAEPVKNNTWHGEKIEKIIGCWAYYSKQPGTPAFCDYPTLLKDTRSYFLSSLPILVTQHPFVFLKSDSAGTSSIIVREFSPVSISIETNNLKNDTLVFLQNYYPGWNVVVNNQPQPVSKEFISFMGVPLAKGDNRIYFYFKNRMILTSVFVSLSSLIIMISLAWYESKRSIGISNNLINNFQT